MIYLAELFIEVLHENAAFAVNMTLDFCFLEVILCDSCGVFFCNL